MKQWWLSSILHSLTWTMYNSIDTFLAQIEFYHHICNIRDDETALFFFNIYTENVHLLWGLEVYSYRGKLVNTILKFSPHIGSDLDKQSMLKQGWNWWMWKTSQAVQLLQTREGCIKMLGLFFSKGVKNQKTAEWQQCKMYMHKHLCKPNNFLYEGLLWILYGDSISHLYIKCTFTIAAELKNPHNRLYVLIYTAYLKTNLKTYFLPF